MPLARISPTLSRHFSLSFIAFGRSSGLHPVSSHSCCIYVRAGPFAFAWPYAGVHRSTSLMSSSLLLQQCPACLSRLTWIVFVMGVKGVVYLVPCGVLPPTVQFFSVLQVFFINRASISYNANQSGFCFLGNTFCETSSYPSRDYIYFNSIW